MERTEDGRYIVVDGRRWRATDPDLEEPVAAQLRSHLGRARSAVRTAETESSRRAARDRVQLAKEGLGERGEAWWELTLTARRERARDRLATLEGLGGPADRRPRKGDGA
ncbi:biopolymer transporter Tol [Citricoccus nitrophenolicus]|uniref:Biopolymer transporter Tol n=1 Tax=Citricoccus nitrophenolicus TaxID=863575 RepID=A0ABV0IIU9_9MICC